MHIDGIQLIEAVAGFIVELTFGKSLNEQDVITNNKFRELAPKLKKNKDEI